jgi:hypothetical protein
MFFNIFFQSVNVSGKIVVFAQNWQGYGPTAKFRRSAKEVEKAGGVGVLVKSVAPFSLSTPHTGAGYNGRDKKGHHKLWANVFFLPMSRSQGRRF